MIYMLLAGIADIPLPPVQYMGGQVATISTDTTHECGLAPSGKEYAACYKDGIVHLRNPCAYRKEIYARTLCHELGHKNGWPEEQE